MQLPIEIIVAFNLQLVLPTSVPYGNVSNLMQAMEARMFRFLFLFIAIFLISATPPVAKEYYNKKWFDYPDPLTKPRTKTPCHKWLITKVPEVYDVYKTRIKTSKTCINPGIPKIYLLRRDVYFVVTGPSVKKAVAGAMEAAAVACAAQAIWNAKAAAAAAPSPEPSARIAAGTGTLLATFKACVATVSLTKVGLDAAKRLKINIKLKSHWSPI